MKLPLQKALRLAKPTTGIILAAGVASYYRDNIIDFSMQQTLNALHRLRNRDTEIDYITLTLPDVIPALPESHNRLLRMILGSDTVSQSEIRQNFKRIAEDKRIKGVVLKLRGFNMPLADLQSLRDSILMLRAKGKQVICYASNYDTRSYYVASAANEIILQPGGAFNTLGLLTYVVHMRDALSALGLELEAIAISPFKGAADTLTRQDISPEQRQQMDWLLDSNFEMIVQGIAEGRGIEIEAARAMIDNAPYLDEEALAAGYVDGILNEEALPAYLKAEHFMPWEKAVDLLPPQWPKRPDKYIVVLPLSGLIIDGKSQHPPGDVPIPVLGAERVGDLTVVQQVRHILKDKKVAGVVLFIDSNGGSATASEAMAAAFEELAKAHPIVSYMHNVAASGGYYIATPSQWIVAQPGTITGSIGVLSAKVLNSEMLNKLRFNAVEFRRGANAAFESSQAPYTDEQRAKARSGIQHTYDLFVERVAASRNMSHEAVNAVAEGRVWTGQQAFEHGLVDELGGLEQAITKARQLANLPEDAPAFIWRTQNKPIGLQVAEEAKEANPAALLGYMRGNLDLLFKGRSQLLMPFFWQE